MRGFSYILSLILLMVAGNIHGQTAPIDSLHEKPVKPDTILRAMPITTAVDNDDEQPQMMLHYYDKHGNALDAPVRFLATLDTVQTPKSKPTYPLFAGVTIGADFGDALMAAFGQKFGSYDLWASVSLHNWFFPIVEAGVGYASDTPDNNNYSYRTSPSFYAKVGLNYNFLYKSNPDYNFYIGVRGGYSTFKYDVTNVSISSDYWGESQLLNLRGLCCNAFYGEALIGLQVRIVKHFSLGWNIRWHFPIHISGDAGSKPWFIPGYGSKASPLGFNISASWTIPAKTRKNSE